MELSLFFKNTLFSQDRWPCDYRPHYVDINMHLMSDDVVIHFFYGLYLALKIALSLLVFPKNEKKKKKKRGVRQQQHRGEQRGKRQIQSTSVSFMTSSIRPKCQPPPGVREIVFRRFPG